VTNIIEGKTKGYKIREYINR